MRAIVVAHPDDEALWLSAALAEAGRIIFCYGDQLGKSKKSAARQHAVAALPLPGLTKLNLPESGTRKLVDWASTEFSATGQTIANSAGQARYDANFTALLHLLRPALAGCTEIYTHNPWGEYGHPEHVQTYRAIALLQPELGYTIWFSNYVSPQTWRLANQTAATPCYATQKNLPPNTALARKLFFTYWRHGAWTYPLTHRWPRQETYFSQTPPPNTLKSLEGVTLLDVSRLRWWRNPDKALCVLE